MLGSSGSSTVCAVHTQLLPQQRCRGAPRRIGPVDRIACKHGHVVNRGLLFRGWLASDVVDGRGACGVRSTHLGMNAMTSSEERTPSASERSRLLHRAVATGVIHRPSKEDADEEEGGRNPPVSPTRADSPSRFSVGCYAVLYRHHFGTVFLKQKAAGCRPERILMGRSTPPVFSSK